MNQDVDLAGAAAMLHRSPDWMRRNWRAMVDAEGFPRPFVGGCKGGRPWWRIDAIDAWKAGQTNPAAPAPAARETPANDPVPTRRRGGRVEALLAAAGR